MSEPTVEFSESKQAWYIVHDLGVEGPFATFEEAREAWEQSA